MWNAQLPIALMTSYHPHGQAMGNTAYRKPSPSPWWQKKVSGGGVRGTEDTGQGHWAKSLLASSVCPSVHLHKRLQSKQRHHLSLQTATLRRLGEWQEAPRLPAGNHWDKTVIQYKVNALKRDSSQDVPSQRILEETHLVTSCCPCWKQPSNRVMGTGERSCLHKSGLGWREAMGMVQPLELRERTRTLACRNLSEEVFSHPRTQSLCRRTQGPTEKQIP